MRPASWIALAALAACSFPTEDVDRTRSAACARAPSRGNPHDVSFAREVFPVLQERCAFSTCHGSAGGQGWVLPAQSNVAYASKVRASLLEKSTRASMPYVTPGKPEQSWLLRKIEGDFCGVSCTGGCGSRMPAGGVPLPPVSVNALATWIANDAPDN